MNENREIANQSGILLVDKPAGLSSFAVVARARRRLGVKKIGHGGTLDPFATGLLVLFVGREYTKKASEFLEGDKEYEAELTLGVATDSFDPTGKETFRSDYIPSFQEVEAVLERFQGTIMQVPPMFSAKKIAGKRLYELARKGEVVERSARLVHVQTRFISYNYPTLKLSISCSKGTYIRALAHDIGLLLTTYAHLKELRRTRSGRFSIDTACSLSLLQDPESTLCFYHT